MTCLRQIGHERQWQVMPVYQPCWDTLHMQPSNMSWEAVIRHPLTKAVSACLKVLVHHKSKNQSWTLHRMKWKKELALCKYSKTMETSISKSDGGRQFTTVHSHLSETDAFVGSLFVDWEGSDAPNNDCSILDSSLVPSRWFGQHLCQGSGVNW